MNKYRLRVGLDVDDTLYECNAYALSIINSRYPDEEPIHINEITGWGARRGVRVQMLATLLHSF